MPWAFLVTGSKRVVASLWRVDETSTKDLMISFYGGQEVWRPRSEDFVKAVRRQKALMPHPYYWAAFLWIGLP